MLDNVANIYNVSNDLEFDFNKPLHKHMFYTRNV